MKNQNYTSRCGLLPWIIQKMKFATNSMAINDRIFVNTTLVTTEEGVYRIFIIEGRNGGGAGITAVKIK